ncbi:acrosomal protein KIAA1210 homolog isoform X2 [Notamacropus eugenii]|uniref:acrosomal protein KIAA1210 homolog isoform X2 n=1 Tax=Notamacropus eugenii TaxID=9315 RepID=UPI003B67CC43
MTTSYGRWKAKNDYVMALKSSDIFQSLKTEEVCEFQEPSRTLETQGTHKAQETYEAGENHEAQEAPQGRRTRQAREILEPRGSHDPREPQVANEAQFSYEILGAVDAGEASGNFSGRRKSKFHAFKNFFTKKKTSPKALRKSSLRTSRSRSHISTPRARGNMGDKPLSHENIIMLESVPENSSDKSSQDDPTGKPGTFQASSDQDQSSGTDVEGASSSSTCSQTGKTPDSSPPASQAEIPEDFRGRAGANLRPCLVVAAPRHKMALNLRKQKYKNLEAAKMDRGAKPRVPKAEGESSSGLQARGNQKTGNSEGPGPSVLDHSSDRETTMPDLVPRTNISRRRGPLRSASLGPTFRQERTCFSERSVSNIETGSRPKVVPRQMSSFFIKENKVSRPFQNLSKETMFASRFPKCKAIGMPRSMSERRSSWDMPSCFIAFGKRSNTMPPERRRASFLKLFPDNKKDSLGSRRDEGNESSAQKDYSTTATFDASRKMTSNTEKSSAMQKPRNESQFDMVPKTKSVTKAGAEAPLILEGDVPKGHFASWQNLLNEQFDERVMPGSQSDPEGQAFGPSPSGAPTPEGAQAAGQTPPKPLASATKSVRFTMTPVWPKSMPRASGSKKEPLSKSSSFPLRREASKPSGAEGGSSSDLNLQEGTKLENRVRLRPKRITSSLRLIRRRAEFSRLTKKPEQKPSDFTKALDPLEDVFLKLNLETEEEKRSANMPLEEAAAAAQCSSNPSESTKIIMAEQKEKEFQGNLPAKEFISEDEAGDEASNINTEE